METTAEFAQLPRSTWRDRVDLRIVFSILFVMLLRLPSLWWGVISDDEAIYDAMAQVINGGGVMYRDAVDHKPPGLAYVYAAIENLVGAHSSGMLGIAAVHAFGILLTVLTAIGLYLLAREFLKREHWWLPPVLYGLVSMNRCAYDGLALNGEILMNAPTVFAVVAVIWAGKASTRAQRIFFDIGAGALMGLAGLAKWQALVAGLAFPFFVPAFAQSLSQRISSSHSETPSSSPLEATSSRSAYSWIGFFERVLKRGPFWLLGLVVPVVVAAHYFKAHGVLIEFLQWGGLFNLRYISEGPDLIWALQRLGVQAAAVVLPSLAFYGAAIYGLFAILRKFLKPQASCSLSILNDFALPGVLIWSIVSILCVAIGGRFFGHYFLQAELPLCLLAAAPLAMAFERSPKMVGASIAVPTVFFFAISLVPNATRALYDSSDPDWSLVGQAIADQSKPDETLFVWGNAPAVYHYSHRRMGTRFSFCNYLTGLSPGTRSEYDPKYQPASVNEAWPLLYQDLQNRKPTMILDTAAAGWKSYSKFGIARYPEFQTYLKAHYRPVTNRRPAALGSATLYRRID